LPIAAGVSASATESIAYEAPPRAYNAAGRIRHVGLELEIGHIGVDESTQVIIEVLGGTVKSESPARAEIEGTAFGTFVVEVDSTPIRDRRYIEHFRKLGLDTEGPTAQALEESIVRLARGIVPVEIVTGPIPWNQLAALEPLWAALRIAGAHDTHASPLYAFGFHINPELPDLEVSTVVDYLRSYLMLEGWLKERTDVDLSRRLAPFVDSFPEGYRRKVIEPGYLPNWDSFVDDYVSANPTRNRSIDLLPLIAHACSVDLGDAVENWSKVKPRPTFHYRLPNSEVGLPGWTPAMDWNRWVMVERLAEDRSLCRQLAVDYTRTESLSEPKSWTEHVRSRFSAIAAGERAGSL
jgi:hypothetical protein